MGYKFNLSKINNQVDELAPGVESIFFGGFVTPQVRQESVILSGYLWCKYVK